MRRCLASRRCDSTSLETGFRNRGMAAFEVKIPMSGTKAPVTMHVARMAMNRDPAVRAWVEQWLKARERERFLAAEEGSAEAFDKHWLYVKPETMHEGALEAYMAYLAQAGGELPS